MQQPNFTKKHVLAAAKLWDSHPHYRGFRKGTRYEVLIDEKAYPPKAIASIAHELESGEVLFPRDFAGAREGKWHTALGVAGYKPQPIKKPRGSRSAPILTEEITDPAYIEGATVSVFVNRYERNQNARKACLEHYGHSCIICHFNSQNHYGKDVQVIHVHHITPLSEIGNQYEVDPIKDLRPVCPNCHAVIHSRNPPLSIRQVKKLLKDTSIRKHLSTLSA